MRVRGRPLPPRVRDAGGAVDLILFTFPRGYSSHQPPRVPAFDAVRLFDANCYQIQPDLAKCMAISLKSFTILRELDAVVARLLHARTCSHP